MEFGVDSLLMDTPVTVAIISAAAAVLVSSISFYLTKSKERQADWQRYKFELYKELVQSLSGIVGTDSTPEGNRHFASACNTLHLIGSKGVLNALHDYQDEIRVSNTTHDDTRHDELLTRLEWEIREDLRIPENPPLNQFTARLWCSGSGDANKTSSQVGSHL